MAIPKKYLVFFVVFFIYSSTNFAQEIKKSDILSYSYGIGITHGGLGLDLLYYPQKNVGFFLGLGYPFAGIAYSSGVKLRLFSPTQKSNFVPFLLATYGYQNSVYVSGYNPGVVYFESKKDKYDKVFFGPTIGFGVDTGPKIAKNGYLTFALAYKLGPDEVISDYINYLKTIGFKFYSDVLPVSFSFGLRMIIVNKKDSN